MVPESDFWFDVQDNVFGSNMRPVYRYYGSKDQDFLEHANCQSFKVPADNLGRAEDGYSRSLCNPMDAVFRHFQTQEPKLRDASYAQVCCRSRELEH